MKMLRRTTPVALMVGATLGVLFASFQAVDGIFSNPGLVASVGTLFAYLGRAYFIYILFGLILLFIINLLLCLFFPKRMREADYARLVEYYVGITVFLFILLLYGWKDRAVIGDILRQRKGIFPLLFFLAQVIFIPGVLAFIIAAAVHQLTLKFPKGRLAIIISSLAWFMLLFPLLGEMALLAFGMAWHPILQLILLIVIGFILSFIIKLLNRFTHALIALKPRTWIGFAVFMAICFVLWGAVAAIQPKSSNPKRSGDEINVVLLSIDALRADHVGCYGYNPPMIEPGEFTPNIDKFATEGLLFENAYSTSPWTLASVSSWMTGGWPEETGGTYVNRRLYRSMTSLPEALSEEGYTSGAFVCNPFMSPATAIGRGFSEYWEFFDASHMTTGLFVDELNFYIQKRLDEYGLKESGPMIVGKQLDRTFDWLDEHKDEKFFLWVHLYDPHFPYTPPSPYKDEIPDIGKHRPPQYHSLTSWRKGSSHHSYGLRRHIVNLYDAEIRFSDAVAGQVLDKLDELGLAGDTLVILVSDHGEEFFDHGSMEHGHTVYEEVLHVPFIVRLPGRIPEGERVSEQISLIDLFPTLLDFTGASVEPKLYRGESLMDAMLAGDMSLAGKGQMNLTPSAGTTEPGSLRSIIDDDYRPEMTSEQFPIWEFSEGAKYSEPGLTIPDGSVAPATPSTPATPQDAVEEAASTLMEAVESRSAGEDMASSGLPTGRIIFAEDLFYFDDELKCIRIGEWKLVHSYNRFHDPNLYSGQKVDVTKANGLPAFVEGDELYNLSEDPAEMKNVIYDYPDIAKYLYWRLKEIDYYDMKEAYTRKQIEGDGIYFGAGLKNLTKGFGYW